MVLMTHALLAPGLRMVWSYTSASSVTAQAHCGVTFTFVVLLSNVIYFSYCPNDEVVRFYV